VHIDKRIVKCIKRTIPRCRKFESSDHLKFDSLDWIELAMDLERTFNIEITDAQIDKLTNKEKPTVLDIITLVKQTIGE